MDIDTIYENIEDNTKGPQNWSHNQNEGKPQKCSRSRCLLGMTVSLGLICFVLVLVITVQHISFTDERNQFENTVEELNVKTKKVESIVTSLDEELKKRAKGFIFISDVAKNWSESRKQCKDRGADLVNIKSEEKQLLISSIIKETCWIGLSDIEKEGSMKWVDNSPLGQGFWFHGEPNDLSGIEDCVDMNPGHNFRTNWNDLPCSEDRKAICEKF